MDTKLKLRNLVQGMDDAQLGALAGELATEVEGRRQRISIEDISVDKLRNPAFAAEVRAELDAVLKGMR